MNIIQLIAIVPFNDPQFNLRVRNSKSFCIRISYTSKYLDKE